MDFGNNNGKPFDPLPGCGFDLETSRPHFSRYHPLHDPPDSLVAIQHTPVLEDGTRMPPFHTPFEGQTNLPMFGIRPEPPPLMRLSPTDHSQMLPPPGGPLGGLIR